MIEPSEAEIVAAANQLFKNGERMDYWHMRTRHALLAAAKVRPDPLNFEQFQKQRHDFDKRELTPAGWVLEAALYRISQLICTYARCPCNFDSDICDCECGDRCSGGLVIDRFRILEREMERVRADLPGQKLDRSGPDGYGKASKFLMIAAVTVTVSMIVCTIAIFIFGGKP